MTYDDGDDLERIAKAIHRAWVRFTPCRHVQDGGKETPDQAHERRWNNLPSATRTEFMSLAEAAVKAMPVRCQ